MYPLVVIPVLFAFAGTVVVESEAGDTLLVEWWYLFWPCPHSSSRGGWY